MRRYLKLRIQFLLNIAEKTLIYIKIISYFYTVIKGSMFFPKLNYLNNLPPPSPPYSGRDILKSMVFNQRGVNVLFIRNVSLCFTRFNKHSNYNFIFILFHTLNVSFYPFPIDPPFPSLLPPPLLRSAAHPLWRT